MTDALVSAEDWARHRHEMLSGLPPALAGESLPSVLLPYQRALLAATARTQLVVVDKSRRIGATWGIGADAVLTAGAAKSAGGMDVLYLGYNLDMAREFVDCCAMWARAFSPACSAVQEFLFRETDERGADRAIQAFRISFASGFEVVALSSRPRSLRGRQGYVILDEFAFHDEPEALLQAAIALLIWGGRVLVISTHNGVDNPFNVLIQEIREQRRPGEVVRCTFDAALEQGLYQRICLVGGKPWSPEAEAKFRADIRGFYGAGAAEELDCIPAQGTGVYLTGALIEACMTAEAPVLRLTCPQGFELCPDHERASYVDDWLEQHVAPVLRTLDARLRHAYGYDFARSGDLSVMVPLAEGRDLVRRTPFVIEMRNVPFREQERILFHVVPKLPRFSAGKHDARGNGQALAEFAVQKFGPLAIEAVMPSQPWYIANVPPLKRRFEDRTVAIPRDSDLKDDLRQLKMVRGVPKVPEDAHTTGTDGGQRHGDFAIALVLANAAMDAGVIEYGYRAVLAAPRALGEAPGDSWMYADADDRPSVRPRDVRGRL